MASRFYPPKQGLDPWKRASIAWSFTPLAGGLDTCIERAELQYLLQAPVSGERIRRIGMLPALGVDVVARMGQGKKDFIVMPQVLLAESARSPYWVPLWWPALGSDAVPRA